MNGFISSFSGEYKRHLYRINMIAWAIILGIMLFHANAKVNLLKQNQQKIDAFKKIQKTYFEDLNNYLMYQRSKNVWYYLNERYRDTHRNQWTTESESVVER